MTKSLLLVAALALMTIGCKSKRESLGDEHLEAKRYRNAIGMYTKAEAKGEVSEEFNDNYSIALLGQMEIVAKKNAAQEIIHSYFETLPAYLDKTTKPETAERYVEVLMGIGKAKIELGEYQQTVQAFQYFKEAERIVKSKSAGSAIYGPAFKAAEAKVVANALSNVGGNPVVSEYYLLEANKLIPENAQINEALNVVRKKNIHNFLLWSPDINGITPSTLIDKNGWSFAFRGGEYKKTPTSLNGFIEIWNFTNNNSKIVDAAEIKLYSVDGKSIDNTKKPAKACTRMDSEKDCTTGVSFKYGSDFIPSYIQIKNGEGQGKKYLPIG